MTGRPRMAAMILNSTLQKVGRRYVSMPKMGLSGRLRLAASGRQLPAAIAGRLSAIRAQPPPGADRPTPERAGNSICGRPDRRCGQQRRRLSGYFLKYAHVYS